MRYCNRQHKKRRRADAAVETPWYDLIDDPEPPEDAMQQASTISDVMSVLRRATRTTPNAPGLNQSNIIYDSAVPGSVVSPDGAIGARRRGLDADRA